MNPTPQAEFVFLQGRLTFGGLQLRISQPPKLCRAMIYKLGVREGGLPESHVTDPGQTEQYSSRKAIPAEPLRLRCSSTPVHK